MSMATKIWLIVAASLVVLGSILFAAVMTAYNWDFVKLSTVKYETNTYEVSEKFTNISLKTDTADITLAPSIDGRCSVVCYEMENAKHSVAVQEGTLAIGEINERKWYEYIGITIGTPKITVFLPEAEYTSLFINGSTGHIDLPKDFRFENVDISTSTGDVKSFASASERIKIKTSTGCIHVENVSANMLDLSVSTGEVIAHSITCKGDVQVKVSTGHAKLMDVVCENVTSNGNTGHISMKNVVAADKFFVERSTGDVEFDGCDAGSIFVKTDTGDVRGTFLTDKVFITQTDTGHVDIPKTVTGGRCEITTDTGDILIKIEQ